MDEHSRGAKLQQNKPLLSWLSELMLWEAFRLLLEKGYTQQRNSNAGRKRIAPLILFRMLILKQLFNLSDEEHEFQLNDNRSLEEFFVLGLISNSLDATTISFF